MQNVLWLASSLLVYVAAWRERSYGGLTTFHRNVGLDTNNDKYGADTKVYTERRN